MAEVGLLPIARIALQVCRAVLPRYRTRFSKHEFTQPQFELDTLLDTCNIRAESSLTATSGNRHLEQRQFASSTVDNLISMDCQRHGRIGPELAQSSRPCTNPPLSGANISTNCSML